MVADLAGIDEDASLLALGMPAGVEFEDRSKAEHKTNGTLKTESKMPDWAFLQLDPSEKKAVHRRRSCISLDGVSINTMLLSRKRAVISSGKAFGKNLTYVITEDCKTKLATLLACCPSINGNGVMT